MGGLDEALVDNGDVAEGCRNLERLGRRHLRRALLEREVERGRLPGRRRRRHLGRQRPERLDGVVEERRDDDRASPFEAAQFVREQLLVGLDVGARALDVQVQEHAGESLRHLLERREGVVAVPGRLGAMDVLLVGAPGSHRLTGDPPVGVVHLAQLRQGEVRDLPVVVGRAVDGLVVAHDDSSVPGRVDVKLDGGGTSRERPLDRRERRGRPLKGPALVGVGDDSAREPGTAHGCSKPFG